MANLAAEAQRVVGGKPGPIVAVDLGQLARETSQDALDSGLHDSMAPSRHHLALIPSRGHIHHLHGVEVVSLGASPPVADQIYLHTAGPTHAPGDAVHRPLASHRVGPGAPSRQLPGIPGELAQDAPDCGDTHLFQLVQDHPAAVQLPLLGKLAREPLQSRGEPLGTRPVEALHRHQQCRTHLLIAAGTSLPGPLLSTRLLSQQLQRARSVPPGHRLHLAQKPPLAPPVGLLVAAELSP